MGVRFHKDPLPSRIPFETMEPNEFEVNSKIFHLSCNFQAKDSKRMDKKEFAKFIEVLGGTCTGCNNDKITKKVDYLVIGKEDCEKKPKNNCLDAIRWNHNPKNKHIHIISQDHCEELVAQYGKKLNP